SIRHSHPRWMVDLWWDWLGPDDTRALLAADNEPAELALRVNALVDSDLDDVPGRREGEAIVVDGPFDALAHPGYAAGAFTPQSRASQLVARALAPERGERVLDLCAAPGGKTTHLAALMEGTGEVVAVERRPQRARALQATAARMRAANVTVVTADANDYDGAGRFDRVLLDPPCSGLGTLRSHPDLRWRTSPEAIERLAAEQDVLLASARRALAPGGALVYSVCTLSPREERLVTADVQRTLPHVDGTDGFYIARDGG
ncbi:MAG TPA: RsmB/NOP family class I SAM-dependent RNA methyltransferase, partial [Solirubrobacteraceae bacterium]|nr:RsmB/NOP family class I SAM-dependent RNA methyltransferase [Solirubrobacteraceae bacterium]